MASSVNPSMHAVRGFFKFAHIDGLIVSDPAVSRSGQSGPSGNGTADCNFNPAGHTPILVPSTAVGNVL